MGLLDQGLAVEGDPQGAEILPLVYGATKRPGTSIAALRSA